MKKLFSIIFMSLFITACSAPVIPTSAYVPQNYTKVNGSANLGEFSYLPAEFGLMRLNQIENTAIGSVMSDEPIAEIVKKATALELKQSGMSLGNGKVIVDGRIKKLKVNDVGFSVDWFYTINYRIRNATNNALLFDREYSVTMQTNKFVTLSEIGNFLNKIIASGFEKFINDNEARRTLEQK